MNVYRKWLFPVMEALSKDDAEKAHTLALRAIQVSERVPFLLYLVKLWYGANRNPRPLSVFGIKFPNRIGLAAGLDKQAQMLLFLQAIGFGFIEVGTVVPKPQPGNPRPRVKRLPSEGLWNAFGFNSDGAYAVSERLTKLEGRIKIPIGVSLGKQSTTPLDDAAQDYVSVLNALDGGFAFVVVNVSSPNTKGLRKLQGRDYIEALVGSVVGARDRRSQFRTLVDGGKSTPVLVKLSPDMTQPEMEISVRAAERSKADGFILGNTTVCPPEGVEPFRDGEGNTKGGYSGPWTFPRTLEMVTFVRHLTPLPIIACGGITGPCRAFKLYDAGADLLQVLTPFVYQGPGLIRLLRHTG